MNENTILYSIWISLSFFLYGSHYSLFPTVTVNTYGKETGVKLYPLIFSGFALSTIIGVLLAKLIVPILEERGTDSYIPVFYI